MSEQIVMMISMFVLAVCAQGVIPDSSAPEFVYACAQGVIPDSSTRESFFESAVSGLASLVGFN